MKDLYLMRHGETLFNRRDLIQGIVNAPLLVEGVAQALHTRKAYFEKNNIQFDHVFTSPLGRAVQTTELVTDLPFERVKGLHEMSFGRLEGCPCYLGCPKAEFPTYYGTIGGETTAQVQERMNRTLISLMDRTDVQCALAVAHGCANQAFSQYWAKDNETAMDPILFNCSVLHYEYEEDSHSFHLKEMFNENWQTEDLEAARATGMGMELTEITAADFC